MYVATYLRSELYVKDTRCSECFYVFITYEQCSYAYNLLCTNRVTNMVYDREFLEDPLKEDP